MGPSEARFEASPSNACDETTHDENLESIQPCTDFTIGLARRQSWQAQSYLFPVPSV